MRTDITQVHAEGMLRALHTHECPGRIRCPYALLDMTVPADRALISRLYAFEAREVMGR